jgi:hypothetical protein
MYLNGYDLTCSTWLWLVMWWSAGWRWYLVWFSNPLLCFRCLTQRGNYWKLNIWKVSFWFAYEYAGFNAIHSRIQELSHYLTMNNLIKTSVWSVDWTIDQLFMTCSASFLVFSWNLTTNMTKLCVITVLECFPNVFFTRKICNVL